VGADFGKTFGHSSRAGLCAGLHLAAPEGCPTLCNSFFSPKAIRVCRLSSGKPAKNYPENPVDPVKKYPK
jgi:hypothetical protein